MQLPAYLQNSNTIADTLKGGLGTPAVPYVSLRDNRFTLIDAAGLEKPIDTLYLDVIIADANAVRSRTYYAEKYNSLATDYKPPTCFSDNGQGPSSEARDPQSPTCAACQWAVWGSAISQQTGEGIPACRESKNLAVLVPGVMAGAEPMAFRLKVPPMSLKALKEFTDGLQAQVVGGVRIDPVMIVTRLTFSSQGVLKFTAQSWIDEATAKFLQSKGPNPYPKLTGSDDRPRTAALPAPQAAPAIQAPQPAPAPQPTFGRSEPPAGFGGVSALNQTPVERPTPQFIQPTQQPSEPQKRHRRTKAEMEAARAAQGQQQAPAFQAAQQAPQASFGIVSNAPEPSADLNAAIANAFNLPM